MGDVHDVPYQAKCSIHVYKLITSTQVFCSNQATSPAASVANGTMILILLMTERLGLLRYYWMPVRVWHASLVVQFGLL